MAVPKDGSFSNLFGARFKTENGVVATAANFRTLEANTATITDVTATTVNGSASSLSLINCNPNELLATNASTNFVSIPYTSNLQIDSVPLRSSQFTTFSQLFLTDTSNQIVANISPKQVTITAPTPSSSRVYSFQMEGPANGVSLAVTSTPLLLGFGFLDESITTTQMAIKSTDANANLIVDSAAGNNSLLSIQGDLWSMGNFDTDDTFRLNYDLFDTAFVTVADIGGVSSVTTVRGDLLPLTTGLSLGLDAQRWDSVALNLGTNKCSDLVSFTSGTASAGNILTTTVNNTRVTTASNIVVQVEGFDGTLFTNGYPYAVVTAISNGSFELAVYNASTGNDLDAGATQIDVRYWVLN